VTTKDQPLSAKKRLLIVTEPFHPSLGGQEIRYMELGGIFVGNGWQVHVATIGIDRDTPKVEEVQGISVRRLLRDHNYKRPNSTLRRNPVAILKFAWKVRRYLHANRYDLVIFNLWPVLPQIVADIPAHTVALVDWCEHRNNGLWPRLNQLLSRSTGKHICVSEGLRRILSDGS
jgi:hypothetical protein